MQEDKGEVERSGVSGERKSRVVGGFLGFVLMGVVVLLILAILYFAFRREKAVPTVSQQIDMQDSVISSSLYWNV